MSAMRESTREEVLDELNRLRDAAWWFREMVRSGGPDSSDLDLAVSQDLDAVLDPWSPRPMLPDLGGRLLTYEERRDVSARIPWRGRPDPDPLGLEEPPYNPPDEPIAPPRSFLLVYVVAALIVAASFVAVLILKAR